MSSLLEPFSRCRGGENAHIVEAIGAAARRLAGHLRVSSAYLFEGARYEQELPSRIRSRRFRI